MKLSSGMLTGSLLYAACIHLFLSAAQFGIERRAVLTQNFPPLFCLPPLLFFYLLPPLPESLLTSSSLLAPLSQLCLISASPDCFSPLSSL